MDLSGDGCNDTTTGGVSNINTPKRVGLSILSSAHEKTKPPTEDMDIDGNDPNASFNLDANTALNSKQSSNAGVNEELKTPVWKLSQFTKRHKGVQAIKNNTWKQIKPFQNVSDIEAQLDSAKFQLLWSKFTNDDFSLDLPVSKIKVFVSALFCF